CLFPRSPTQHVRARTTDRGSVRAGLGCGSHQHAGGRIRTGGSQAGNPTPNRALVRMIEGLKRFLTAIGVSTASPLTFLVVVVYAILWIAFDRESLNWHGVATLATWLMTLFIQRAEHRDTQAIQAKLDELLRAEKRAQSELTKIDEKEPEEIEEHRERAEQR